MVPIKRVALGLLFQTSNSCQVEKWLCSVGRPVNRSYFFFNKLDETHFLSKPSKYLGLNRDGIGVAKTFCFKKVASVAT